MSVGPEPTDWAVQRRSGSAVDLLTEAERLSGPGRQALVLVPDSAALVLGSTQPEFGGAVDDLPVVRRRSGGGAVLLQPDSQAWIEVWLPRADPLWADDVTTSFRWLGEVWRAALAAEGLDAEVWTAGLRSGQWGEALCFAGVGSGELTHRGRKVVGISQRRSRDGARFSSSALVRFDAAATLRAVDGIGLIDLAGGTEEKVLVELDQLAAGTGLAADVLVERFLDHLP